MNPTIEATRLGIQNLERVMGYLVDATTVEAGNLAMLTEMYNAVLQRRKEWLVHDLPARSDSMARTAAR